MNNDADGPAEHPTNVRDASDDVQEPSTEFGTAFTSQRSAGDPPTYWKVSEPITPTPETEWGAAGSSVPVSSSGRPSEPRSGRLMLASGILATAIFAAGATYFAVKSTSPKATAQPTISQTKTAEPGKAVPSQTTGEKSGSAESSAASNAATNRVASATTAAFPASAVDQCGTNGNDPNNKDLFPIGLDSIRFESQKYTSCSLTQSINLNVLGYVVDHPNASHFTTTATSPRQTTPVVLTCDRANHLSRCTFGTRGAVALVQD